MKIQQPVALVTGAGSGIGRAIALALAAKGKYVLAVGRTESSIRQTIEHIRQAGGFGQAVVCDIADMDQIDVVNIS